MLRLIAVATLAIGAAIAETKVPKGATQIEPGVYKYTESDGKTHIFRKTPFGMVKSVEKPEKPAESTEAPKAEAPKAATTPTPFGEVKSTAQTDNLKVVERGDVLEFEKPSPFGSYRWKRNKSELTPDERAAWERTRSKQSDPSAGPKE
jgi:hypothetical protein